MPAIQHQLTRAESKVYLDTPRGGADEWIRRPLRARAEQVSREYGCARVRVELLDDEGQEIDAWYVEADPDAVT